MNNRVLHFQYLIEILRTLNVEKAEKWYIKSTVLYVAEQLEKYIDDIK